MHGHEQSYLHKRWTEKYTETYKMLNETSKNWLPAKDNRKITKPVLIRFQDDDTWLYSEYKWKKNKDKKYIFNRAIVAQSAARLSHIRKDARSMGYIPMVCGLYPHGL